MLTLLFPTIVHTRFNDNWLFASFFYYWHYYFSLVFFYFVLFFIKWLYNNLLNFSICKYIATHPKIKTGEFPISGCLVKSFINKNCQNSITSNDIKKKLGSVAKIKVVENWQHQKVWQCYCHGFGHIYWRNPLWKTLFFCAVHIYQKMCLSKRKQQNINEIF